MRENTPDSSPRQRWLGWARDLLIASAVFLALATWREKDLADTIAPAFTATLSDGSAATLAQLLAQHPNKPQLLHFWASWCSVCAMMDDTISNIADDWPVVGVAFQSGDIPAVQAHMRENDLRFQSALDDGGVIAQAYGVAAVPTSFIVMPDGQIASVTAGFSTGWGLRLRLWWARWRGSVSAS